MTDVEHVWQRSANRGPRATFGLRRVFNWPARPKAMVSAEKKRRIDTSGKRLFDDNWQHEFFFAIANVIKKPRVLFAARASLR